MSPTTKQNAKHTLAIAPRVDSVDWKRVYHDLDADGHAVLEQLISAEECETLTKLYSQEELFRSRVIMSQHGYGRGEYKYFAYPLPDLIAQIRASVYRYLVPVANRWNQAMKLEVRYPAEHQEFLARCHQAGQTRPTPLLLKYEQDDFNCLHQDLYGDHVFPLQLAILLAQPDKDFTGGEFILTEQRPRMQTRPMVVPLQQGDGVIFAVHQRPVLGTRGSYRVNMRHGVSRIRSGHRHTAGVIFHDAK